VFGRDSNLKKRGTKQTRADLWGAMSFTTHQSGGPNVSKNPKKKKNRKFPRCPELVAEKWRSV